MLRRIQKDRSSAADLCFVHATLPCLHHSLVKTSLNFFRYKTGTKPQLLEVVVVFVS